MKRGFFTALFALCVCWISPAGFAAERLVVYTVNYPLQYFAERIAGEHAQVAFPAAPGADPAFWQPDAETIGAYQRADVILLNGAGYAKWIDRVSLPRRKLVNTSAGFRDRLTRSQGGVSHSHGLEGEHSHAGTAFTTWLDFEQAVQQARAVFEALSRRMPEQADTFSANFQMLEQDLLNLDARLQAIVAHDPSRPLLASHPVYQYLARRYSLNLQSVMWEPDAMPSDSAWQVLAEMHEQHPASWMLWEAEPAAEISQRLGELGVGSVVFAPCANRPENGDFLSVMSGNLASMEQVFAPGSSSQ
jgi:zinc transport system substrate-binding protein